MYEPHNANQLDKLDRPVKHLDELAKSTDFTEHCGLGETTNLKNSTHSH